MLVAIGSLCFGCRGFFHCCCSVCEGAEVRNGQNSQNSDHVNFRIIVIICGAGGGWGLGGHYACVVPTCSRLLITIYSHFTILGKTLCEAC